MIISHKGGTKFPRHTNFTGKIWSRVLKIVFAGFKRTYAVYDSATSKLQLWVNAVKIFDADSDGWNFFVGGKIGDGTNQTVVASDGRLTFEGTARTKREIRIPVSALEKGASAPTEALRSIGASGAVKKAVLQFSKITQQDIYFEIHPNYHQDDSANHEFHIVWIPGSGWTSGNYVWKLEYLIKTEAGGVVTTGTPTTISVDVTPSNATDLIETTFADTYDLNIGEVLFGHLYRDVASDNGNDTADLNLIESEYTVNSLGEAM